MVEFLTPYLLPVFLGASHALEPGHGKTALTLFSAQAKLSLRFVVTLIGGIAISHTLALSIVAALLYFVLSGESQMHFVHGAFGLLGSILLFYVAWTLWPRSGLNQAHAAGCQCPLHGATAASENNLRPLTSESKSTGLLPLSNPSAAKPALITPLKRESRTADKEHSKEGHEVRTAGLIGIGGGLVPCPTAVAAFLTSVQAGAITQGIGGIVAFLIGLILTLVTVALIAHRFGSALLGRAGGRFQKYYPYVLSAAIAAAGLLSLYHAASEGMSYLQL